jgi:hypothetical protein
MLNGADAVAVPTSVPTPVFCTVNVRSAVVPTRTEPKSRDGGDTTIWGPGIVHRSASPSLRLGVSKLNAVP